MSSNIKEEIITLVEISSKHGGRLEPSDMEFLEKRLDEWNESQVMDIVKETIDKPQFLELLALIFLGLPEKLTANKKRFKVIETVLNNIHSSGWSSSEIKSIIFKMSAELGKLTSEDLMNVCSLCLDGIRSCEDILKICWKVLLPPTFELLCKKEEVLHCGIPTTGTAYKSDIIRNISMMRMKPNILTSMAAMLNECQLSSDDCRLMLSKLCSYLDEMDPHDVPPLVHQLLELCRNDHVATLFLHLRNYFHKNLYTKENESEKDIESSKRSDIIEIQSVILQHIEYSSSIVRHGDVIKFCKNAANAPHLILDPFLLSILLVLACSPAYKLQATDALRAFISHSIKEGERRKCSAWLDDILNADFDINSLFSKLINSSICENDKVLMGVIDLAFVLLSAPVQKGRELGANKMWRLGRGILVTLVQNHRRVTQTVLAKLADLIHTECDSSQYTDCLNHLCSVATLTVAESENCPIITGLLEYTNRWPGVVLQRIVAALVPLVKISTKLRDVLIANLRKALFSREIGMREMAVAGFLQLLKFMKLQGMSTLSQMSFISNSQRGPSVLTQITLDVFSTTQQVHATINHDSAVVNEAICLEVLGILKRCFSLQASVKNTLYNGLYQAISVNPELCVCVLDVLLDHLQGEYYNMEKDELPPLKFDKVAFISGMDVILQEPIGKLLLLIQNVLVKATSTISGDEEDSAWDAPYSVKKLTELMNSLVVRFVRCDLHHFNLDEDTNLVDIVPESVLSREIVQQVLHVYEALMAYVMNSWHRGSTPEKVIQMVELHKGYNRVAEFAKNSDKPNKNNKKDAAAADKPKGKKGQKKNKDKGPKKIPFKKPLTILNFNTIGRILSLFLLDEVSWCSIEALNEMKPRKRLFLYAMESVTNKIIDLKSKWTEFQRSSSLFKDCQELSKLLFEGCVKKFSEAKEMDLEAAILGVQCFQEIFSLISDHFHNKFPDFLQEVVSVNAAEGIDVQLVPVMKAYKHLLNVTAGGEDSELDYGDYNNEMTEPRSRGLTTIVLTGLQQALMMLPKEVETTERALKWLFLLAENQRCYYAANTKIFMNLLFSMQIRCKKDLTLFDTLVQQLCHLFPTINEESTSENENAVRPLIMINDNSKEMALIMLCSILTTILEDVEFTIIRFKSEHHIIPYMPELENDEPTQGDVLKKRERELCQQLTHVTLMVEKIVSIAPPMGPCLESVLKFLTKTYAVLKTMAKYFTLRSSPASQIYYHAGFHKLVKIAGSELLRAATSELTLFVERNYGMEVETTASKKQQVGVASEIKKQEILLPKVVVELENFYKAVFDLGKKCKDQNMTSGVKLTVTRDFKLNPAQVGKLIEKYDNDDEEEEDRPPVKKRSRSLSSNE